MADDTPPLPPEGTPPAPTPPPPVVPDPPAPVEPQLAPEIPAVVESPESAPSAPEVSIPGPAEIIPAEAQTAHVKPETTQIPGNESFASPPAPQNAIAAERLVLARKSIQSRKQKKLARIMEVLARIDHITNDGVEKLLHVSHATATRYLSILEKEGRIVQIGKTGKGVVYKKL